MAHDVFISYSTQDKAVADAVCAALETKKIRCWIAPRDVMPGIPYAKALLDGINQCQIFVLVFSADSNTSPQVMREVEIAVKKGTPIIPLRIEDVTPSGAMEYYLSVPHWLDAMTPPLERHLQKLANTVQALLTTEAEEQQQGKLTTPTLKPIPRTTPGRKLGRVHILVGALVIVLIVLGVIYLTGGFGGQDETGISSLPTTTSDLTSTPTPTPTSTTTPVLDTTSVLEPTTSAEPTELAAEHYNLGLALLEGGQYELAISEFNKVIEIDPSALAYFNRGMSYYYMEKYDLAIADYTKAIELDPSNASAYNFRGDSYLAKGEYDIAIADFSEAISISSWYDAAYHDRAIAYYYKGEYGKAISDLTAAIEISPNEPDYYNFRGFLYKDTMEYDKAIADFDKTLELEPTYDAAYFNRGICYRELGMIDEAIADLERCIELSQDASLIQKAQEELSELR